MENAATEGEDRRGTAVLPIPNSAPVAIKNGEIRNHHHGEPGWIKTPGAGSPARIRLGLILSVILLLYCGLGARLVQIQVGQHQMWKERVGNQEVSRELLDAERGSIYDCNYLPLAYCVPRETVIADLKILVKPEDRAAAAQKLSPLLSIPVETLEKKLDEEDRRVVYLARKVEPELADKIRALKIKGIGFEDGFRRTYPQGTLACHLIGWAGIDDGKEGIEVELDAILKGTPGYLRYYRDAAHRLIALNDGSVTPDNGNPPRDGLAVCLTIDARIQQTAEEELKKIQELYQPKSATCVMLDVGSGAILAMACTPNFDPNSPAQAPAENRRNRIVTDIYEPGSTFKTFVLSMSLERKLWKRAEMIDCENGAWHLGYRTLHDSHAYGTLSVDDVIAKSSNIGAAKIGMRLGLNGLYDTVRTFGFGERTGIKFPGEMHGKVRDRKLWSNDSMYSVAMGQEIAVTPIQLATAYAAVVNGGMLYRPKIVQRILNERGDELYSLHPQAERRVISEQTSQQMREVLARVVQCGTGTRAFCAEWQIGGKTGTAQKIDPVTHCYSNQLYVGSFCGFAPVENPRVVCLVTVDEPHKGIGYYGGTVACPAVREVIRKALTVLNVPPRSADEQKKAIADAKAVAGHGI
jgi:cell division protein FtsI (penicillin-binding protein 3)